MKKSILLALACACAAAVLAGCSNLAGIKDGGEDGLTDSKRGVIKVNVAPVGRYVQAAEYDLTEVDSWTMSLYLYDESNRCYSSTGTELSWKSGDSTVSGSVSSLLFSDGLLTASLIPAGTYKISLFGSYTPASGGSKVNVSGELSGVEVVQGKSTEKTILMGLAKTSDGKGTLNLTLADENLALANLYSDVIIYLRNLDDTKSSYSYSTIEKDTFTFEKGADGTSYTLVSRTSGNIESGWYKLSIALSNYEITLSDTAVEIADGLTTTGTVSISAAYSKNYYATNDTAVSGNGLATVSRANLNALIESLADTVLEGNLKECIINIYVNSDSPEIELDKLTALNNALAENEDEDVKISIYGSSSAETAALTIGIEKDSGTTDGDGDKYSASDSISGALTLTVGTNTETLDVNTITVNQGSSYTITLKNGAAMNVTTTSLSDTLGICAVVTTGSTTAGAGAAMSDNFGAYTSTEKPFIKIQSSSVINDKIALYEYGSDDVSECYTVSYATANSSGIWTYSYKIKPVVGSIILANGKLVAPDSYTEIDKSNPPVAIAAGLNSNDKIIGIGLHTSSRDFYWAPENTTGATTSFTDIVSTATESQVTSTLTYSFTGDTDGSDNWDVIYTVDENAISTAETNYPAFYWANSYASLYNSYLGGATEGWYMPSIAELYIVFKNNLSTLNSSLAIINTLDSEYSDSSLGDSRRYWSSSQTPSSDYGAYLMSFNSGSITVASKYSNKCYVLVVRAFN